MRSRSDRKGSEAKCCFHNRGASRWTSRAGWVSIALQHVDEVLEEEIAAREERRIKSSLRLSGRPFLKSPDTFDFAFQPSLDRAQVLDLASLAVVTS